MKRHYIPVTAGVPGVNESQIAFLRKVIRTALAAEGVTVPCEIDVRLTDDSGIHGVNLEMRQVDRPTDVLSFPMFAFAPGEPPVRKMRICSTRPQGVVPLGTWSSPWSGYRPRRGSMGIAAGGNWRI